MTSLSIIERNRENAQHSTGPRTSAGKAVARGNSLKHGLCANPASGVIEDAEAFEHLQQELVDRFDPGGPVEQGLIHRIAVCLWRLQRAAVIDGAIGDLSVTGVRPQRAAVQTWIARVNTLFRSEYVEEKDPEKRPSHLPAGERYFRHQRPGLRQLDMLRDGEETIDRGRYSVTAGGEIMRDGAALEAMAEMLRELADELCRPQSEWYFIPHQAQVMAWLLGETAGRLLIEEEESSEGSDGYFYPDQKPWASPVDKMIGDARLSPDSTLSPELRSLVDRRIATLRQQQRACEDPFTDQQEDAKRLAALLPDAATLARLTRYETHAERSLHRSLEMLAKLRGVTVQSIQATITGRSEDGTTVQVRGEQTRWSAGDAAR